MCMKGRWSGGHSSWSGSDHTPCMKTPLSNSSAPSTASQCPSWNGEYWLFLSCTSVPPMARSLSFLLGTKMMCPWMCPRGGIWPKLPVESILLKSQGTVSNKEVMYCICSCYLRLLFILSLPVHLSCVLWDVDTYVAWTTAASDISHQILVLIYLQLKTILWHTYMKATNVVWWILGKQLEWNVINSLVMAETFFTYSKVCFIGWRHAVYQCSTCSKASLLLRGVKYDFRENQYMTGSCF